MGNGKTVYMADHDRELIRQAAYAAVVHVLYRLGAGDNFARDRAANLIADDVCTTERVSRLSHSPRDAIMAAVGLAVGAAMGTAQKDAANLQWDGHLQEWV